jgi:hypothetical protein
MAVAIASGNREERRRATGPIGIERLMVILLALARLALCAYRASHQSIVIDEAFTFNHFVDGPWSSIYSRLDANYHVLYSILAKASVRAFGLSELTLRLPALLAGFAMILGVFWVLHLTTRPLVRWIAIVALSLHPLLLDFSVAARGYGLGLALLIWAIYFSIERRYVLAGTLLGLAAGANLTMTFPALGVICAVVLLDAVVLPDAAVLLDKASWRGRGAVLAKIAAPAAIVFAALWIGALRTAISASFGIGYSTIRESLYSLVFPSTTDRSGLFQIEHRGAATLEILVILLILAFIAVTSVRDLLGHRKPVRSLIPAATLMITIAGLLAAHLLFRVPYPVDRTGVYLVVLFGVAWAIAADGFAEGFASRWVWRVNLLLATLAILQFAAQFETQYFLLWRFDARTKTVAQLLRDSCEGKPEGSVTVSAMWLHQPALEFYRRELPIKALQPVTYRDPPLLSGFDFYVLNESHPMDLEKAKLHVLFSDAGSEIVLAQGQH